MLIWNLIRCRSKAPCFRSFTTAASSLGFITYAPSSGRASRCICFQLTDAILTQVPVRVDYSDLYNLLAFFDGGVDEARTGNHDDLAEEIAMAGADWASKHWRVEDMQACKSRVRLTHLELLLTTLPLDVYRLLLEWARVLDPKRET